MSAEDAPAIGGFDGLARLGAGATSVVYRGLRNGKPYAIKLMNDSPGEGAVDAMLRFRREAAALGRLNHPGLVRVHETGEHAGRPYLVMELLDGSDLQQVLQNGPLEEEIALRYAKVLAGALGEVHRRGMVHRDFKPANVIVHGSGEPKIIDFGFVAGGDGATSRDQMIGTFLYAAPEQGRAATSEIDGRADLYALGCVLFECLTGRPPFVAPTLPALLEAHAKAKAPDVRTLRPETRPVLAQIIAKLLEKDPRARYQTGEGLHADLEALGELEAAAKAGKPYRLGVGDLRLGSGHEIPLVGRDGELKALKDLWDSVRKGNGSVALVEGEGGSGKTRLVRELVGAARNRGSLILTCKCQQGEQVPFGPLREALDDYASRILQMPESERKAVSARVNKAAGEHSPVIRRLTRGLEVIIPPPPSEQGAPDQERFYGAVADFFTELARQSGAVVLQVDDVQWLDEASMQVLVRISKRLEKSPFLLAGTSRNDTASEAAREKFVKLMGDKLGQRLVLKPLDTPSVGQLVAHHLSGEGLETTFVEKLAARSNGNPFAVGEYVRALVDLGAVRLVDGKWRVDEQRLTEVALPADVLDLVISRVASLSPRCVQVLSCAAIAGMVFDARLVQRVGGVDDDQLNRAIREAVAANLLEQNEEHEYGFVHDRVREALLKRLDEEQVRDLNQRLGEALDQQKSDAPAHVFAVARHLIRGRPETNPMRLCAAANAAGALALANFSNQEAYEFLGHAVGAAKRLGLAGADMAQVLGRLGLACTRTARIKEAKEHLQAALANARDPLMVARLHIDLCRVYVALFDWEGANTQCQEALASLGQRFPTSKLGRAVTTAVFWLRVRLARAFKWGLGDAEGTELSRLTLLAETYALWGFMIWLFRPSQNKALIPRLIYVAHRLGARREAIEALATVGIAAATWYPKVAIDEAQAGVRLGEQLGDRALLAVARRATSWAFQFSGEWKKAEEWGIETFNAHRRWMQPRDFASLCNVTGQNFADRGFAREGADVMKAGRDVVDKADLASGMSTCRATLAGCEALLGQHEQASKTLAESFDIFGKRVSPSDSHTLAWACLWGVFVCLEKGEMGDEAEQYIERREGLGRGPEDWSEIHQHYYMHVAWLRLRQMQAATGTQREARHRQVVAALALLESVANEGLKRSNAVIIRAVLAREEGRLAEAERLLDDVEHAAQGFDGRSLLFEVACERARILKGRGQAPGSRKQAEQAVELAAKNGWKQRVVRVRAEFGLEEAQPAGGIKVTSFPAAAGMSMVGTMSMVGSASTVLGSHGRPDRYLNALLQVSLATSGAIDPQAQARAALDEICKVMGADRAFLFLEGDDGSLKLEQGRTSKRADLAQATGYSSTVVKKAHETRAPVVVTGTEEGAVIGSVSAVAHNLRSIMAVPLLLRERSIGVVYVDNHMVKGLFNDYDADVLQAIASHIAIAIDGARAARLELKRKEMERELELTAAVQTLFLPPKAAFSNAHAEVAGFYRPAGQCSGDWWWYEELSDSSVVLLVADVTGHGPAPAMVTGTVAGSFRLARRVARLQLGDLLAEINSQLLQLCDRKYMMTLSALQLFPDGSLRYYNAGGLPMMLLRADGKLELVVKPGNPLGSSKNFEAGTAERALATGDRSFILTDGLSELNLEGGRQLGMKSIANLVKETRSRPVAEAVQWVIAGADKARGPEPQADDVTLAVIERSAPAAGQ